MNNTPTSDESNDTIDQLIEENFALRKIISTSAFSADYDKVIQQTAEKCCEIILTYGLIRPSLTDIADDIRKHFKYDMIHELKRYDVQNRKGGLND